MFHSAFERLMTFFRVKRRCQKASRAGGKLWIVSIRDDGEGTTARCRKKVRRQNGRVRKTGHLGRHAN